jgi:PQQ-like domain
MREHRGMGVCDRNHRWAVTVALLAALAATSCSPPDEGLPNSGEVADPRQVYFGSKIKTITSYRSMAQVVGTRLFFVDPRSGNWAEEWRLVTPEGATGVAVTGAVLVDVDRDTLAAVFYRATYPERGLTPEREEPRVQVYSRAKRRVVRDGAGSFPGEVVGTDPRGYVAFGNAEVVAVQPGLRGWSGRSATGLAVGNGVLLASRVEGDTLELRGYDVASGQQRWRRGFRSMVGIPNDPACAVAHRDGFVVAAREAPLVVDARTGRTVASRRQGASGCAVDAGPAGSVLVSAADGVAGYDLTTGDRLWAISGGQARDLDLDVVSVYDSRVYARTRTQRLILDARTGKEVARDWSLAPYERHDGWYLARGPDSGDPAKAYPS